MEEVSAISRGQAQGVRLRTASSWVLLEAVHFGRGTLPSLLAFSLGMAILLVSSHAPTQREALVLGDLNLRSAWSATMAAVLVLPLALDPRAQAASMIARSLGMGALEQSVSVFIAAMMLALVDTLICCLILVCLSSSSLLAIHTSAIPSLLLQIHLYLAPLLALGISLRFLPFGVAERALLLAIVALFTHRILSPHALPLDLLALHPAGDSWLQSSRTLGESILLSASGSAGGVLLSAAVQPLNRDR